MLDETSDSRSRRRDYSSPLDKMNEFLESKDVSPVRHTVSVPWNEASGKTRRRQLRKAQQAINAVLDEVAPNQSGQLWNSLVETKNINDSES